MGLEREERNDMAKCINIEQAIEIYRKSLEQNKSFVSTLQKLPSVEIVRCKDCKYGEYREDFDNYLCDQLGLGSVNDADFFCSYGERKGE